LPLKAAGETPVRRDSRDRLSYFPGGLHGLQERELVAGADAVVAGEFCAEIPVAEEVIGEETGG
jgi:hypothetical protein